MPFDRPKVAPGLHPSAASGATSSLQGRARSGPMRRARGVGRKRVAALPLVLPHPGARHAADPVKDLPLLIELLKAETPFQRHDGACLVPGAGLGLTWNREVVLRMLVIARHRGGVRLPFPVSRPR
jgi:hypothetical protein